MDQVRDRLIMRQEGVEGEVAGPVQRSPQGHSSDLVREFLNMSGPPGSGNTAEQSQNRDEQSDNEEGLGNGLISEQAASLERRAQNLI